MPETFKQFVLIALESAGFGVRWTTSGDVLFRIQIETGPAPSPLGGCDLLRRLGAAPLLSLPSTASDTRRTVKRVRRTGLRAGRLLLRHVVGHVLRGAGQFDVRCMQHGLRWRRHAGRVRD